MRRPARTRRARCRRGTGTTASHRRLLMQIATPHGRTVKLFSEFGMLAKLGVNSA